MPTVAYSVVAAPTVTPYRFGLFSVAEIRTAALANGAIDDHWRLGVTWETQACGNAKITVNPCIFEEPDALESDRLCSVLEYSPFTVYAYNTDAIPGHTLEDHRQNAIARLQNGEQRTAEEALWQLMGAASGPATDLTTFDTRIGLGWVEQQIAERYGSQGVIHMNRQTATVLADYLKADGAIMRTTLGTPVVVGGGYDLLPDPPVDTAYIVGTGPIVMYRSDVDTQANAVDKAINDVSIVAQRDYLVGWDCVVFTAEVSLGSGTVE